MLKSNSTSTSFSKYIRSAIAWKKYFRGFSNNLDNIDKMIIFSISKHELNLLSPKALFEKHNN